MFKRHKFFYSPDDSSGNSGDNTELTINEMVDFMKDDDEKPINLDDKDAKDDEDEDEDDKKKPVKKTTKDEKDDEEESDEDDKKKDEDEEEEELELLDEELEQELITPARKKEILAKYPKLFKDFPYLEVAYYRDQQFTEILPTIADAKTAVEKSETLDAFEADLLNGNTEKILDGLKKSNPESLNKLVDNFLPTLYKVDSNAYFHVMGNVIKHTIVTMAKEAKRLGEGGEPLNAAAVLLNQFVFGNSEFTPPEKLSKDNGKDENEEKLTEREQKFVQRQFENARDSLSTKVENAIKATIEVNIDPNKSMTDYVKRTAIRDAREQLAGAIDGDKKFKVILDRLWEQAFKSDFSSESLNRIRTAYLSKAKTLLPQVIKKARNEALKGLGKRTSDDKESEPRKKGPLPVGKSASSSNSGKSSRDQAKEIPRGMKTIDYLMQD